LLAILLTKAKLCSLLAGFGKNFGMISVFSFSEQVKNQTENIAVSSGNFAKFRVDSWLFLSYGSGKAYEL